MHFRCYATLPEFFGSLIGKDLPAWPINTYGFFVGLGFFVASYFLRKELIRRKNLGLFTGIDVEREIGKAPTIMDVLPSALFAFLFGFKVIGIFVLGVSQISTDYIFSLQGSWIGGIVLAALFGYSTYNSIKKEQLPQAVTKKFKEYPHDQIWNMVIVAAISGVLGSNLFNALESPGDFQAFLQNPIGSLFSGLSIYGGLIFGGLALLIYAYKKKINVPHLFDALAPAFILAYAIGRQGCMWAGDGDWGIANLNPKPAWIPQILWSFDFSHNVNMVGEKIAGCTGPHCYHLVPSVYPTPMYETLMSLAIFGILWALRKKLTIYPGMLVALLFIFNGIERWFIEKIRVNEIFWKGYTQAEVISVILIVFGLGLCAFIYFKGKKRASQT